MDDKTRILHNDHDIDPVTGASSIPIYQVSTYAQKDPLAMGHYQYARGQNPTREALEGTVALLENGKLGMAFPSGMAAISTALLLFSPGDHLVVSTDIYGGTFRILTGLFKRWGLEATFVDMTDPALVEAAVTPKTKALFVETPSNPTLTITDLREMARIAKEKGLLTLIDNTFMTPYLQKPLDFGFDISLHSATKFLGGHSDLIAGIAVTREELLGKRLKDIQNSFGSILGPQDSWLVLRGIKTLSARLEAQQKTAGELAKWLSGLSTVRRVYYPALPSHPGSEIHLGQSRGGGAIVSFELPDGKTAHSFMKALKLPLIAISLGGCESILSYPATMSHSAMPREERYARGISDGLVRLSVGLESAEDLKEDIEQALKSSRA
ncbi:aminotransferase class V-fold PLP-dependent enzyme [bacterium]|nr:MAG: aminotransferase class V-fold PLP-dependent enzyme [bacterium]